MNAMTYKGYTTKIEYSSEDDCLIGHILGIQDIVGFHGDSVEEARQAFEETVDDYLDICVQMGKKPQKPFSGKILLRVQPEDHALLAMKAQMEGKSVNSMLAEAVKTIIAGNH
jgi:predicted HicB family RNase H-like nuclease